MTIITSTSNNTKRKRRVQTTSREGCNQQDEELFPHNNQAEGELDDVGDGRDGDKGDDNDNDARTSASEHRRSRVSAGSTAIGNNVVSAHIDVFCQQEEQLNQKRIISSVDQQRRKGRQGGRRCCWMMSKNSSFLYKLATTISYYHCIINMIQKLPESTPFVVLAPTIIQRPFHGRRIKRWTSKNQLVRKSEYSLHRLHSSKEQQQPTPPLPSTPPPRQQQQQESTILQTSSLLDGVSVATLMQENTGPINHNDDTTTWMTSRPVRMPSSSSSSVSSTSSSSATTASGQSSKNNSNNKKSKSKYFIPVDQLDQLIRSINLVSLIEAYELPQFRRTGDGYQATCICPFHDDHNPSLKIDGRRGVFKCFSCGTGGNAIQFIRGYAELHTGKQLSFVEAVRLLDDIASSSSSSYSSSIISLPKDIKVPMHVRPPGPTKGDITMPESSVNKNSASTAAYTELTPAQQEHVRQRLLLANLHAAAFYEQNLYSLPSAGSARAHLRSRNINPYTVKAYSIGFAPETYFLSSSSSSPPSSWGEGSLVNHLKQRGFTAQEILDAGLAIQTKHSRAELEVSVSEGQVTAGTVIDYSNLMDRFRGRLIVPIFDGKGNHVVGFGGRILETEGDEEADNAGDSTVSKKRFKAAKYLNSPESLVFHKKNLLFGQHIISKLTRMASTGQPSTEESSQCVLIVEGYMDAIALWQAGVKECVSSMGTAISFEQLAAAAQLSRNFGGRIVLCLDNDDAGLAAVKRLCTGPKPLLYQLSQNYDVEIHVASLPDGVKDPAEYLEVRHGAKDLDRQFRDDVIKTSVDWTEWYASQSISGHTESKGNDQKRSFSDLFEEIAFFMAIFESTDMRAKLASSISTRLADLIDSVNESDSKSCGPTIQFQIEGDLLERSAAIIHSRTIAAHRALEISDESQLLDTGAEERVSVLSPSLEISANFNDISDRIAEKKSTQLRIPQIEAVQEPAAVNRKTNRLRTKIKRPTKNRNRLVREKYMTQHVRGLQVSSFDELWLVGDTTIEHERTRRSNKNSFPQSLIRFNSNEYHGKWTTDDALSAGYHPSIPERNIDFLQKGTGSLVGVNEEETCTYVEDTLLKMLLRSKEARSSLRRSISVIEASGAGISVDWTSPAKKWLFQCIMNDLDSFSDQAAARKESEDCIGIDSFSEKADARAESEDCIFAIRTMLAERPDVPDGAFGYKATDAQERPEKFQDEVDEPIEDNSDDLGIRFENDSSIIDYSSFVEESPKLIEMGKTPEIGNDVPGLDDFTMQELPENEDDWFILERTTQYDQEAPREDVHARTDQFDPISSTDKMESIDAEFVEEIFHHGSLDHIFYSSDETQIHVGSKSDAGTGNSQEKSVFAVQDLFTILQSMSVLRRVRAGRMYLSGTSAGNLVAASQPNASSSLLASINSSVAFRNESDLIEYCSSHSSTGNNNTLRCDLHRMRSLIKAKNRATERVFSLIGGGFSDENARMKGYSWMTNMLRFNRRRMVEGWSELIEATEGFQPSAEASEDVIAVIESVWQELCDENVMWEWKHVDTFHMSPSIDGIDWEDNESDASRDEVLDQIEDDWSWVNDS